MYKLPSRIQKNTQKKTRQCDFRTQPTIPTGHSVQTSCNKKKTKKNPQKYSNEQNTI